MLSIHSNRYRHGLLVFDHEGCGDERRDRVMIQNIVEGELAQHWNGRARAVVIAPEIEAWLWSDSPHVDKALGWEGKELRATLRTKRFLLEGAVKPHAPKAAVEFALRAAKKPRSSGLYKQIAQQVSLDRCEDPSFLELRAHLTSWFGLPQPTNEP